MPITLGSKIIFWWSAESWLFTWHVIVNSCSGPPYAEFKMPWRRVASLVVPLPALRSWYQAPQKKCKSWAAPLLWQQSGREQLPDACCYFCLCCWQRKLWFIYWELLCVCTHLPRLSCEHRDICSLPVDGHSVRRQMLSAVELVPIEALFLGFVQGLVMPRCWVCPRNCLFVLKWEEARPASSSAFACEPEMLVT